MATADAHSGRERPAPQAAVRAGAAVHHGAAAGGAGVNGNGIAAGGPDRPGHRSSPMSPPDAHGPAAAHPVVDFAAEYQRAYRVLWVVAAGVLGRSAGAEDVVQEAALLGLRKLDEFVPGTHFAAWMAQMVRFVALNQLRKQTRNAASSLHDADPADLRRRSVTASSGEELRLGSRGELPTGQNSFDDALMRGLSGLSDVARACLLLRTLEGMDYEQIGRVLGVPQGTAMSHVHRSRMRLREHLTAERQPGRPADAGDTEKRRT
jgi:RNA polymerase sigma-70 factor (ECF subfamily)